MGCNNSKSTETTDSSKSPGKSLTEAEAVALVQKELGLDQEQAEKLVKKCDSNNDGQVSEKEVTKLTNDINKKKTELKKVFEKYDKDNTGEVTLEEGLTALKAKFPKVSESSLRAMLTNYDKDSSGKIKYDEFIYFYAHVSAKKEKLSAEFKKLDTDGSGTLSLEECQTMLEEECCLLPFMAYAMFCDFDANHDDKLNKDEFENMWVDLFG